MALVYVVSGWMRSGTSMMMQAMQAGGMSVTQSVEREQFGASHSDQYYQVNPGGMFELPQEVLKTTFPQAYTDQVVKIVVPWLQFLIPTDGIDYRMLFMFRDTEELRQAYEAAFNRRVRLPQLEHEIRDALIMLRKRPDVQLLVVPYRSVVYYPLYWMQQIKYAGWPIDPSKAASIVDPSLYTFKKEDLVAGL